MFRIISLFITVLWIEACMKTLPPEDTTLAPTTEEPDPDPEPTTPTDAATTTTTALTTTTTTAAPTTTTTTAAPTTTTTVAAAGPCQACTNTIMLTPPGGPPQFAAEAGPIGSSGGCASITLMCPFPPGALGVAMEVAGGSGFQSFDSDIQFPLTCNADNKWEDDLGRPITSVYCEQY